MSDLFNFLYSCKDFELTELIDKTADRAMKWYAREVILSRCYANSNPPRSVLKILFLHKGQ